MNIKTAWERILALLSDCAMMMDDIDEDAVQVLNEFINSALETWPDLGKEDDST